MANPQQSELRRSEQNEALSPDATHGRQAARRKKKTSGDAFGPIPEDNLPNSHPEEEQDKPDLDDFASKLGVPSATGADETSDEDEARDDSVETHEPGAAPTSGGGEPVAAPRAPGVHVVDDRAGRAASRKAPVVVTAVVSITTKVVLGPWIVVGNIAERVQVRIHRRVGMVDRRTNHDNRRGEG